MIVPERKETTCTLCLESKQDTDHEAEQHSAFDEGRAYNHGTTNVVTSFRLTGHAFEGRSGQTTDTEPAAKNGQPHPNARTEPCKTSWVHVIFYAFVLRVVEGD